MIDRILAVFLIVFMAILIGVLGLDYKKSFVDKVPKLDETISGSTATGTGGPALRSSTTPWPTDSFYVYCSGDKAGCEILRPHADEKPVAPKPKKADKSSAKKKQGKHLDATADSMWIHHVPQFQYPAVPSPVYPTGVWADGDYIVPNTGMWIYPESTPAPCVADWQMAEAIADFLDKNADKYKDTPEAIRTLTVTLRGLFPCLARKMK